MGGDNGGSTTVVQSDRTAPQILPEAKEGFNAAQNFYKSILTNPPQYNQPRLAPVSPGQQAAITQSYDYFGTPQPYQTAAENQVAATSQGDWLNGPEAQQAVASLSDPIFRRFRDETLPQIRDRSQFSGQGLSGSRREVANQSAVQNLGDQLARSAYAPVYNQERDRMMQAAQLTPTLLSSEALRTGQLAQSGAQERGFNQQILDMARQVWEEPLFRQSGAASSLLSASGFGPGGTTSTQTTNNANNTGDQIASLAGTALVATALLAGKK